MKSQTSLNHVFTFAALVLCVVMVFATSACSSQKSAASGDRQSSDQVSQVNLVDDLTELLRGYPGLEVRGTGPNADIAIRGRTSISLSNEPLFVVNGQIYSGDYSTFYSSIDVNTIKKIEVLKGSDTSFYGSRGANGVIKITLIN
jgi:outer membrane receptor for ferrienterochelin and colicin